ncbi:MAG: hypothetical protein LBL62_02775 [Planctomycetaceae bacterium]|nr:hypothetical protein [Planctomycetaceae bacterium]
MNQINNGKWSCFPCWSQCKLNRRNRPAGFLINSPPLFAFKTNFSMFGHLIR